MASTYVNDLRLNEMATGDASGTWGEVTNTNLELIAEAFSYGTEAITTNADTHTTTIADGATDPGRSLYLKYTGTLDSACTITIGPNTVSKLWFIENATSGSQNIIISQGSGANVTIPAGETKVVYSDGAGSGAAMTDAFASLKVSDAAQTNITSVGTLTGLTVNGDVTLTGSSYNIVFDQSDNALEFADNAKAVFGAGSDLQIYHDGSNSFIRDAGTGNLVIRGTSLNLQKDGGESYITMVADGAVTLFYDNASKLATTSTGVDVAGTVTATGTSVFASLDISGDIDVDGTTNLDVVDIDGAVDMASTLTVGSLLTVNDGAVFNEGSADKDFRVESNGQTHALFVDGGLDNVGIGYSAAHTATNKGLVILTGGGTGGIQFNREDGSYPSDGESLGSIAWKGQDSANTNAAAEASIEAVAQENMSGSTAATDLVFNTKNTGTGPGSAPTERLRLKRDGNLYLGGTASGGTPALYFFNNDSARAFLKASGTGFVIDSDSTITFQPNNTARMLLASSGALGLGTTPKGDQHTGWSTLYVGEKASLFSENDTGTHGIDGTFLTDNIYIDSDTGSYAAITNNESSAYRQEAGIHQWFSQASASAGAAVTVSEKMRLNASGELNIGTTGAASGSHRLVVESASTTGTVNSHIALIGDSATNGQGPQILFSEAGDGQAYAGGTIGFTRTGGNSQGDLLFSTRGSSGDATTTAVERLRITNEGDVSIGSDHAGFSGWRVLNLRGESASGALINYEANDATRKAALAQSGNDIRIQVFDSGAITFEPGTGAERGRFTSDGLTFNGDTAAANALDDYEIGTWTPTIIGSTTNPVYGTSAAVGDYIKIGDIVHANFLIIVNSVSNAGAGNKAVSGLPFANNQNAYQQIGLIGYNDVWNDPVTRFYITGQNLQLMPDGVTQSNYTGSVTTGYFAGQITYSTST